MPVVIKCYCCQITSDDPASILRHDAGGHQNPSHSVATRQIIAAARRCVCGHEGAAYTVIDTINPKSISQEQLNQADYNPKHVRCRACVQMLVDQAQQETLEAAAT